MSTSIKDHPVIAGLLFVLLLIVGVGGGIYVGNLLTSSTMPSETFTSTLPDRPRVATTADLAFGTGMVFPFDSLGPIDSTFFNHQLLSRSRSVIVFAALGCDRCDDLLDFWKHNLDGYISPELPVIIALDDTGAKWSEGYDSLIADKHIIRINAKAIAKRGMVNTYPTIYCLARGGRIDHVQVGFRGELDESTWVFLTNSGEEK